MSRDGTERFAHGRKENRRLALRPGLVAGFWAAGLTLLWMIGLRAAHGQEAAAFRIGFSAASFTEVNENDANAAVKIWAQTLARERGIPADPQPQILRGKEAIANALIHRQIDAINLTLDEFWCLKGRVPLDQCVVGVTVGSIHEEYVLIVHRESGIAQLGDLRGRSLALMQGPRSSLAPMWLDTILVQAGFSVASNFLGRVSHVSKTTKVVLPVFFRQVDACVTTRRGFATMVELNPQTGRQLKVLATSPSIVPFLFCFRADYDSPIRQQVLKEIGKWHTTPAGRQILNLFQCDALEERPLACLNDSLALLDTHQQLNQAAATNAGTAAPPDRAPIIKGDGQ